MKKALLIIGIVVAAVLLWIAFCGYQWSWGPFHRLHDVKTARFPGNAKEYAPENVASLPESPLSGRHIIFLGSSVTYGSAAKGVSFAEYIAIRNGCTATKEAVSGTTLTDSGLNSYVARLKTIRDPKADLFVCQLSTNDASQKKPLGSIADGFDPGSFDTKTVAGAIEWIIAYAREKWNCPVVFYTSPRYDSEAYADMQELLTGIAEKWEIGVIDLWADETFNAITPEQRALYLADAIHPTQAGYLLWWTPVMERKLYDCLRGQ